VLLLFDIDGTLLLRASAAHRAALLDALHGVYGLSDPGAATVLAAGRTDGQIGRSIAVACGLPARRFDELAGDFQTAVITAFERRCPPTLAKHVAPGIRELLDGLSADPAARTSLLTGNYEPIARMKLDRAGIGHHFPPGQGAFGSDAEQRDLLGPIARARAGTEQSPYPREQTTIIGDTPLDIACARADGLRVIAIATGPYAAAALAAADAVAADAYALRVILRSASG